MLVRAIQQLLFPALAQELGPLSDRDRAFIQVVELARVDDHIRPYRWTGIGRKPKDRKAIALAFIAKAVYQIPTTRMLIETLKTNRTVRHLCGWDDPSDVPDESCFSRAFKQFAEGKLPELIHEAMVRNGLQDHIVEHISRDSTAIHAREKRTTDPSAEKQEHEAAQGNPQDNNDIVLEPIAPAVGKRGKAQSSALPTQPIDVILADVRKKVRRSDAGHQAATATKKGRGAKGGNVKKDAASRPTSNPIGSTCRAIARSDRTCRTCQRTVM
jgi:hypothetical protein